MSKVKIFQKHILHLDLEQKIPEPNYGVNEPIIQALIRTKKEKCSIIGINSVYREILHDKVAYLIVSNKVNPIELISHLLALAETKSIKVISTSLSPREIGQRIGTRSSAVAAILKTAPPEILTVLDSFSAFLPSSNLPHLIVETDMFVPRKKQPSSSRTQKREK